MFHLLLIVHGLLCITLIGLVLLQQGKGADAGALTGGGADSIFGPGGGGSFATRLTTGIAIAFMLTSIMLVKAYQSGGYAPRKAPNPLEGSLMEQQAPAADEAAKAASPSPAASGAPAAPAAAATQAPVTVTEEKPKPAAPATEKKADEKPAKK